MWQVNFILSYLNYLYVLFLIFAVLFPLLFLRTTFLYIIQTKSLFQIIIAPLYFSLSSWIFCSLASPIHDLLQSFPQCFPVTFYKPTCLISLFELLDIGAKLTPNTALVELLYLSSKCKFSLGVIHFYKTIMSFKTSLVCTNQIIIYCSSQISCIILERKAIIIMLVLLIIVTTSHIVTEVSCCDKYIENLRKDFSGYHLNHTVGHYQR